MPANILAAASRFSFAHLSGFGRKKSAAKKAEEEQEDEEIDEEEQDSEDGDSRRAEDKKDDDETAESDETEEGDEDDKPAKGRRARRAAAEEDEDGEENDKDADAEDDDSDEEMRGKSAIAKARRRERARCAAIFAAPQAAHNVRLAASLAFNTTMTRKEAINVLKEAPAAPTERSEPAHASRAARNPQIGPGGVMTPGSSQAIDASWDRAIAKVSPKTK